MQVILDTADVPSVVVKIMGAEAFLAIANDEHNDEIADLKIRFIELFCDRRNILGRHAYAESHMMLDVAKGFGWNDIARAIEGVFRNYGY